MESTPVRGDCRVSLPGSCAYCRKSRGVSASEGVLRGMDCADEGLAPSRSTRGGGRLSLVHRTDGEHARANSIQRQERSRSIERRPRIPDLTVSLPTRTATSGSPPISPAISGSLIRRRARSSSIVCLMTARDPHTPVFDQIGNLWFTVQGADMIGRLVPKTGEIKLVPVPTADALPYGIAVNSEGVPYFAEFGTNKLASINPKTMEIHEYPLPNADSRPRRVAITSDDAIWYTDYSRGYLGRFDPKTGSVHEWPSPSGPNSGPYGIHCARGRHLVQRIRRTPEHTCAFRLPNGKVRDLGDPFRRRRGAQHDGNAGRQARSGMQRRGSHRIGRRAVVVTAVGALETFPLPGGLPSPRSQAA